MSVISACKLAPANPLAQKGTVRKTLVSLMQLHLLNPAASPGSASEAGLSQLWPWPNASRGLPCWPTSPRLSCQGNQSRSAFIPSSSGQVASFCLRACSWARCRLGGRVTPSLSMASWAPWKKVNPSAMTSILRPSSLWTRPNPGRGWKRSSFFWHFPAHLCRRAFKRKAPSTQVSCLRARCTMNQLGGHTGRCVRTRGNGKERRRQKNPQRLGLKPGHTVGGDCCDHWWRQRPMLGCIMALSASVGLGQ